MTRRCKLLKIYTKYNSDGERFSEIDNLKKEYFGLTMEENAENEIKSKSHCVIENVLVPTPVNTLHLGTQITINGPVTLKGLNKDDILILKNSKPYRGIKNKNIKLFTVKRFVNNILINWNLKKCLLLGFLATLIEILLLIYLFIISSYTGKDNIIDGKIISYLLIKETNKNIQNFVERRDWGMDHECTFQCPILQKTKIKLILTKPFTFFCSTVRYQSCAEEFENEYTSHRNTRNNITLNDLYYNYVIGMQGYVYEGRSLTCPFDDNSFFQTDPNDHSLVITIGIPYCFNGNSKMNEMKTYNEIKALKDILNKLTESGILIEDHTVEYPDVCIDTLLHQKLPKAINRPPIFHENQIKNITSRLNQVSLLNLMFRYEQTNKTDPSKEVTFYGSLNFPVYDSKFCTNHSDKYNVLKRLTVRFVWRIERDYINSSQSKTDTGCYNFKSCRSVIKRLIHKERFILNYGINFFVFNSGHIFKGLPLTCSIYPNKDKYVISIVIFESSASSYNSDEFVQSISDSLRPIVEYLYGHIKYDSVEIEFLCNFWYKRSFSMVYQLMTNVKYVTYDDIQGFNEVNVLEC